MDLGIQGRKAAVAAASTGLGFGCAKALIEDGVEVVAQRVPTGANVSSPRRRLHRHFTSGAT